MKMKKNTVENTYLHNHSKKLRQFIYKYRHLFNFSKEIWIQIFFYLNTFIMNFHENMENEKKEIHIPPNIFTLEVNYLFTYMKDPYQLLKSVPKNIQNLHSHELSFRRYEEEFKIKTDIFFLYPFRNLIQLTFNEFFNLPLTPNIFPESLRYLNLGHSFEHKLLKNVLPKRLETLILSYEFNHPIKKGILPDSLVKLVFGNKFNKAFKRNFKFPSSLEKLYFYGCFNQGLRYSFFPKNLKSLKITYSDFDHRIQRLPRRLIELYISNYQYDIDKSWLPFSIQSVIFNKLYGNMLFNYLPINLKHFSIHDVYEKPILFNLHSNIDEYNVKPNKHQKLGENFYLKYNKLKKLDLNYELDDFHFHLPDSVEVLNILRITKSPLKPFHLPYNLVELNIQSNYSFELEKNILPPNLKKLVLTYYTFPLEKDVLPIHLKTIELFKDTYDYPHIIQPDVLPSNLEVFKIYLNQWNKKEILVKGTLPKKLKELSIYGNHTNFPVGFFNYHLEKLKIEKFYQPIIKGLFPNKLKNLSFHSDFNHEIHENALPKKLRYLNLGNSYSLPLRPNVLPKSLIHLSTGDSFNHSLVNVLHENIKYLHFGTSFTKTIPYEQLVHLKKIKLFYPNIQCVLINKPSHVLIDTFEKNQYPSDNDSYGYYSD